MGIFTSRVTKDLTLADGTSVVIRKLAPKHLDLARKINQAASMRDLRDMGGPAFIKEVQSALSDPSLAQAVSDPLNLYDATTLLAKGIVSWSLPEDPKSAEVIDDIDDDTRDVIAREVLMLSKPSLFVPKDDQDAQAEANQKNG